jgi:hypothetical protein
MPDEPPASLSYLVIASATSSRADPPGSARERHVCTPAVPFAKWS